jgi:death on curing protein
MQKTVYLTLEQILFIHQDQIERYGGSSGLRDLSLLESAIFRPQTMFSGRDLYHDYFEKAAALLHSLIMNHAFIDGNKRTGATAMLVFLELNNINITIEQNELVKTVIQIENEKWKIEQITKWLESKITKK